MSGSVQVTTPGQLFLIWKSSDSLCAEFSNPWRYCTTTQQENTRNKTSPHVPNHIEMLQQQKKEDNDSDAVTTFIESISQKTIHFQHCLVLRKWVNLFPAMLFKCIVAKQTLLAACQSDSSTTYKHLKEQEDHLMVHNSSIVFILILLCHLADIYIQRFAILLFTNGRIW